MAKKALLLVDPDAAVLGALEHSVGELADVESCADFRAARSRVLARPPDLLVTNLKLGAYNGLHLVLLAARAATRCVVYATEDDLVLAREVQSAGAFYERAQRLPFALPSYLEKTLPSRDRRAPTLLDRRLSFRGGRRCTDLPLLHQSLRVKRHEGAL